MSEDGAVYTMYHNIAVKENIEVEKKMKEIALARYSSASSEHGEMSAGIFK